MRYLFLLIKLSLLSVVLSVVVGGCYSTRRSSSVVSVYASRVTKQISRQFKAPSSLSKSQLRRLKAVIAIKLVAKGKLVAHIDGDPKWISRSGNATFDEAAMRALVRFKEGGLKLPLPKSTKERSAILARGFKVTLTGADP